MSSKGLPSSSPSPSESTTTGDEPVGRIRALKTDAELVQLIVSGNRFAFDQLFLRYYEPMFRLAYKYFQSHELAGEAVQEVFFKMWQKRSDLDAQRSVKGLLFRSLRNHILNMIRSENRRNISGEEPLDHECCIQEDTTQKITEKEIVQLVRRCMSSMSDRKKEVVELRLLQGYSNQEVADRYKVSVTTVKSHYYHALKLIKTELKKFLNVGDHSQ